MHKVPPDSIQETLARYLAENDWAPNTASMGNLMQSELALSAESRLVQETLHLGFRIVDKFDLAFSVARMRAKGFGR